MTDTISHEPPATDATTATPRLLESFTRLVAVFAVPPAMTADQLAALDRMTVPFRKRSESWWRPLDAQVRASQSEYLLPWVRSYLGADASRGEAETGSGADCVARAWSKSVLQHIGQDLEAVRRRAAFGFRLKAVEFYLFSTGVGIVVIDCELRSVEGRSERTLTLDDLVAFNYAVHYVEGDTVARVRRAPVQGGDGLAAAAPEGAPQDEAGWQAAGLIAELRSAEGTTFQAIMNACVEPMLSASHSGLLDRRAFRVQSFARVAPGVSLEDLAPHFYRLRRVASTSYPAAPEDLDIRTSGEVVRTYENIAVGSCLEGMAVLLIDTGHPFYTGFAGRARRSYFAHYLLALHQRATLLVLALDAGRLPSVLADGVINGVAFQDQVARLRTRAIDFTLRHRFSQLSTMTHYALVYESLTRQLRIPDLLDEVRDELSELDEILGLHQTRLQHDRAEAARAREHAEAARDRRLQQMIAGLGPLGLLLALFGSNLPIYKDMSEWVSAGIVLPTAAWILVTAVLLIALRPRPR